MRLFRSNEERAAEAERELDRLEEQAADEHWDASPPVLARAAFTRGDRVFQCAIDLMHQTGTVSRFSGASTQQEDVDPNDLLNAVVAEGWDLVTGSVVFVPTAQESRGSESAHDYAASGTTVGYYLFRRRDRSARDNENAPGVA